MSVLCVIPARGGSRELPQKNLRTVDGVSLIVRAVRTAMAAETVDRVVVSTDDEQIICAIGGMGAEIVRRPDHLAGDHAGRAMTLWHAANEYVLQDEMPDIIVMTQCTSPFTAPEDIDGTVEVLQRNSRASSSLSVTEDHCFLWEQVSNDFVQPRGHDKQFRQRRQDMVPQFRETGAVYAFRGQRFLDTGIIHHGHVAAYEQPAERAMEIDTEADLERANALCPIGQS